MLLVPTLLFDGFHLVHLGSMQNTDFDVTTNMLDPNKVSRQTLVPLLAYEYKQNKVNLLAKQC